MVSGREAKFGAHVAEFQSIQLRIAEAAAELDAARRMILGDLRDTHQVLESAGEVPVQMRARNLRDMAFAPLLAKRAVDRLFYASGAESLDLDDDLQRYYRDVNAGAQQICLNWDANGSTWRCRCRLRSGSTECNPRAGIRARCRPAHPSPPPSS